ncbi:EndoU domain-containing protein [Pasteurella sp. PK-2025]|uniref:EndoU domain-containing protein n=1 Tax=Pasteurella sp. PK-2025 TaxID=3413133 RepID=UPI003C71296B
MKVKTDPTAPKFLEKRGKNQDSASMMFPRTWTEVEHAFKNRVAMEKFENKWEGTTKSGVKVEWVLDRNGKVLTIYPSEKQGVIK